jgi:hypothetical protein
MSSELVHVLDMPMDYFHGVSRDKPEEVNLSINICVVCGRLKFAVFTMRC